MNLVCILPRLDTSAPNHSLINFFLVEPEMAKQGTLLVDREAGSHAAISFPSMFWFPVLWVVGY